MITFSMGCYFKGPVGVDNPTIINKLKQSQRIKQDNNKILNQEYLQFYVVLTRPVWMKEGGKEGGGWDTETYNAFQITKVILVY